MKLPSREPISLVELTELLAPYRASSIQRVHYTKHGILAYGVDGSFVSTSTSAAAGRVLLTL